MKRKEGFFGFSNRPSNEHLSNGQVRSRLRKHLAGAFTALAMVLPIAASAAVFYVAPNGSDSNPGTLTAPFKTIQRALDGSTSSAKAGDTVYVRGGVYRGVVDPYYAVLSPVAAGLPGQPITIQAYQGEKAILKGSQIATNWTLVTDPEFTTMGFPAAGAGLIYKLMNCM